MKDSDHPVDIPRRDALRLGGAALAYGLLQSCSRSPEPMDTSKVPESPPRVIRTRTRGHAGGPITRLVSPSDLGEVMKPFVFLDRFDFQGGAAPSLEFGWHPHSGIATVTVVFDGAVRYAESTGHAGVVPAGGIEWMRAGGGVWHSGTLAAERVRGFQLWVTLPPSLENAASAGHYVMPDEVPSRGPVRLVLGQHEGLQSPIASPEMTYLAVSLRDGERWTFAPRAGHDVAWVALLDGTLRTPEAVTAGELAVFDRGEGPIAMVAQGETRFVLGAAPRHPHDLVLGHYSVHTSATALAQGEAEIRRIGQNLLAEGRQSHALRRLL
jgi:redox-sensitive bicupin YhaK (pirin superfamily)